MHAQAGTWGPILAGLSAQRSTQKGKLATAAPTTHRHSLAHPPQSPRLHISKRRCESLIFEGAGTGSLCPSHPSLLPSLLQSLSLARPSAFAFVAAPHKILPLNKALIEQHSTHHCVSMGAMHRCQGCEVGVSPACVATAHGNAFRVVALYTVLKLCRPPCPCRSCPCMLCPQENIRHAGPICCCRHELDAAAGRRMPCWACSYYCHAANPRACPLNPGQARH